MRIRRENGSTKIWISARDTYDWAHKSGAVWPCSVLSGHRLYAEFDRLYAGVNGQGDLVDLAIDGNHEKDCPTDEFNAIIADMLGTTHLSSA